MIFPFKKNKIDRKGDRGESLPLDNQDLPNSSQPNGLCPRCNKQSSFEFLGELPATFDGGRAIQYSGESYPTYQDRVVSLMCRNCKQPVVVVEEQYLVKQNQGLTVHYKGLFWWPFSNNIYSEIIPENVQSSLEEAKRARFSQCFRASAVMSRRSLEALCSHMGYEDGTLFKRLEKMSKDGTLQNNLFDWANEIRLIGNSGAHFDPINEVLEEDANQIILFLEEVIKYLIIMPYEIEKRRQSKE